MQRCDGKTTTDPTASGMEPQCNEIKGKLRGLQEGGAWPLHLASSCRCVAADYSTHATFYSPGRMRSVEWATWERERELFITPCRS